MASACARACSKTDMPHRRELAHAVRAIVTLFGTRTVMGALRFRQQILGPDALRALLLRWRVFFYVVAFSIWFAILSFVMRTNKPVRSR